MVRGELFRSLHRFAAPEMMKIVGLEPRKFKEMLLISDLAYRFRDHRGAGLSFRGSEYESLIVELIDR
jgi:hypothetical protein